MKYMLERAEPYIVKTELTKNRTCQTYRRIVRLSDLKVMYQTFEW